MAKKTEKSGSGDNKSNSSKKPVVSQKRDLLDILDDFFNKRSKIFFYVSLAFATLFSLLLFDVKVGIGGDDSTYITRAYDFIKDGVFPGYQGPLYPMILSPFIGLFGIHIALLKFISFIFTILAFVFLYKAFRNSIPKSVFFPTLILISINYFVLYFASQTYSEALFFFLQSLLFWYFVKHFQGEIQDYSYKSFIILGLILFCLSITKNIGIISFVAVITYFILKKQWKNGLLTITSFLIFFIGFEIVKRIIWGNTGFQFSGQGSGLMYKNFYDPSKGTEDFIGFVNRLTGNSNLYFSKHIFSFLGLRPEITEPIPILAGFIWVLIFISFFSTYKKNTTIFFLTAYVIISSVATFLVLQTTWDQWRLVINLFPLILLVISGGLYYTFKSKNFSSLQIVIPVLAIVLFFTTFNRTGTHVKTQKEILGRNLKGDMLYGFTPDWVNYIQMSQWVAANTPKNELTAVRKSNISFIYSNRKFFNISTVPSITVDSLLNMMNDSSVYIGVKMSPFLNSKLYAQTDIKSKTIGFISGNFSFGSGSDDGNIVGVYKFSKDEFRIWESLLKTENLYYDTNIQNWIKQLPGTKSDYAIYIPEILLDVLHKANVKYMILASLRANPYYNTGNIITTLHRYVNFIQMKYPSSFLLVHTIGTEEISQLVKLNI